MSEDDKLIHYNMILKKTIDTMALAADILKDSCRATELAQQAVSNENVEVQRGIMRIADLMNNGCIKQMCMSPSSPHHVVPPSPVHSTKKKEMEALPMAFDDFVHFATGKSSMTRAEFVVPKKLYNGNAYRAQVEKKDDKAIKWDKYKETQKEYLNSKGFFFDEKEDKEEFLKKASFLTSQRKRLALWAQYKTTCYLLMGMKVYERSTVVRKRSSSASSSSSSFMLQKTSGDEEEESEESEEEEEKKKESEEEEEVVVKKAKKQPPAGKEDDDDECSDEGRSKKAKEEDGKKGKKKGKKMVENKRSKKMSVAATEAFKKLDDDDEDEDAMNMRIQQELDEDLDE